MEKIVKAHKRKLKPTVKQIKILENWEHLGKKLWNIFLYKNKQLKWTKDTKEEDKKSFLTYFDMTRMLTELGVEQERFKNLPRVVGENILKRLSDALKKYMKDKEAGFPYFKRAYDTIGLNFRSSVGIKDDKLKISSKLGLIKFQTKKDVPEIDGKIKNVIITHDDFGYYASIQYEENCEILPRDDGAIGIDVGVHKYAVTSDKEVVQLIDNDTRAKKLKGLKKKFNVIQLCDVSKEDNKIKKLQQALALKVKKNKDGKPSNRWEKTKEKLRRWHTRRNRKIKDFIHKATTYLASKYSTIIAEDLQLKNMTKKPKTGTKEKPAKGVKAKHTLNNRLTSRSFHEFLACLEYKLAHNGGKLIKVNARQTSQICSKCGYVDENNRNKKNIERFKCKSCGYVIDADLNASINILNRGKLA